MSGAIKRLPGEKFADFAERQKKAQTLEETNRKAALRHARWARKANRHERTHEVSDFDYSMNG